MKTKTLILITSLAITISACKKDDEAQKSIISTLDASAIDVFTATCGGNITSDGGSPVTERGVCCSTTIDPTISDIKTSDGEGTGSFTSALTGLQPNTKYYAKAYATNKVGTAYGDTISFTTLDGVMDIDGNVYHTVTIGAQTWLKENLKTTRHKDGTSISLVIENTAWSALATPGYCWYSNNEATYKNPYGALYNWYTVNTGNLCPTGWHVPTDEEWTILIDYLGGLSIAGGKLKETGTAHWAAPNIGNSNSSGFTALPGGLRSYSDGTFDYIGYQCVWWSSTSNNTTEAWRLSVSETGQMYRVANNKKFGFSVRCLKN